MAVEYTGITTEQATELKKKEVAIADFTAAIAEVNVLKEEAVATVSAPFDAQILALYTKITDTEAEMAAIKGSVLLT